MPARATNLNRHGAAVQLNRELLVGSVVLVRNKRGTEVSARVVAQLAAGKRVKTFTGSRTGCPPDAGMPGGTCRAPGLRAPPFLQK